MALARHPRAFRIALAGLVAIAMESGPVHAEVPKGAVPTLTVADDVAARHYAQLLAFAQAPADPLSDGVVAEQILAALAWGDAEDSAAAKDLRRKLVAQLAAIDVRLAARLQDDPAVLALRLGPLRRADDTPEQRAAWASRLEELDAENLYAVFKLVDRAADLRDAGETGRALLLGILAVRYDDHRLALARAMHARRLAVPADLRPDEAPIALDVVAMPMLDLRDNSRLCTHGNTGVRRVCTLLYTRVFEQARDLQTARVAAGVLAVTGDADVQAKARTDLRRIDWMQRQLGEWMLADMPDADEYVRDVLADGALPAAVHVLQRRGVALEPPADWVDPEDAPSTDAPGDAAPEAPVDRGG